jgi:hypothetical protein
VTSYYTFDQDRALREASYFVATPLEQRSISSVEDLDGHGEDAPRLLDAGVMAFAPMVTYEQGKPTTGESAFQSRIYDRDAFLPMIGDAYMTVDFIVGTTTPLAFYQNEVWAGFDPQNDDYDYDQIKESYEEACAVHIRALIGDAIPAKFDLWEIRAKMQDQQARITSIRYHGPQQRRGAQATAAPPTDR